MALYQYNGQLMQAVSQQNGEKLGGLICKPNLRKKKKEGGFKIQTGVGGLEQAIEKLPNIDEYCSGQVQSPYDEIMSHHFKALIAVNKNKFTDAYTHQCNLVKYPFYSHFTPFSFTSSPYLPNYSPQKPQTGSFRLFTMQASTFVSLLFE
jgi:hypothetical protein